jgi:hypothetical protein
MGRHSVSCARIRSPLERLHSNNRSDLPLRYLFLLIPLAGGAILPRFGYNDYTLLLYLILSFLFVVGLLILLRGWLRDAALVLA